MEKSGSKSRVKAIWIVEILSVLYSRNCKHFKSQYCSLKFSKISLSQSERRENHIGKFKYWKWNAKAIIRKLEEGFGEKEVIDWKNSKNSPWRKQK